jgi:DNA-binding beta-propeller fold protein YncE
MKKVFLLLLLFSAELSLAQQKPQTAFIVKEKDLIPEGIAFDPASGNFYLSSIQKRKIVVINKKGEASDFVRTDQDGILSVLGMKVDAQGRLWACNNTPESDTVSKESNVHVYESTGKLSKVYILRDGKKHLFNDVHFLSNGDTYVTDSEGGSVYVIKKGSDQVEEFIPLQSLVYPNGIAATPDEKKLFVVTGSGLGIVSIDLETKKIASVGHPRFMLSGFDGLYLYKNTLIGIQNNIFPEAVIRLYLSADYSGISKMEFIASNEPQFDTPTTGVIRGDYLYFIANSQLFQIIGNRGRIKNQQELNETIIMKIKLN